jgi:hypothetical protein
MFGILLPICLLVSGVLALIYRQQAGLLFCRVGKAIWRVSTFGISDMHWFYPEDKSPRIGLLLGLMLCFFGITFGSISVMSFSGPNSFAAMYQAEDYLKKTYGDSKDGYSLSCHAAPDKANDEIVHYTYSAKTGNLRASWDGKKYTFTEEP